ncbi:hypothetical protein Btru_021128 [Bulinus truncatus]|nr:hypothetical protein Btru_021128 [Bulinus truncatus]
MADQNDKKPSPDLKDSIATALSVKNNKKANQNIKASLTTASAPHDDNNANQDLENPIPTAMAAQNDKEVTQNLEHSEPKAQVPNSNQPANINQQNNQNISSKTENTDGVAEKISCCTVMKALFGLIIAIFLIVSVLALTAGTILAFSPVLIYSVIFTYYKSPVYTNVTSFSVPTSAEQMIDMPLVFPFGICAFLFGFIWFIICILGCLSCCIVRCKKSHGKNMLITFAVMMSLSIVVEIILSAMFLARDSQLHDDIKSNPKKRIEETFDEKGEDSFSKCINFLNYNFGCCGIDGVADFGNKKHKSCRANVVGCYTTLINNVQNNILYEGLAVSGFLLLQLALTLLSTGILKGTKQASHNELQVVASVTRLTWSTDWNFPYVIFDNGLSRSDESHMYPPAHTKSAFNDAQASDHHNASPKTKHP